MKHGLVERKTRETEVSVEVTIDGKGIAEYLPFQCHSAV